MGRIGDPDFYNIHLLRRKCLLIVERWRTLKYVVNRLTSLYLTEASRQQMDVHFVQTPLLPNVDVIYTWPPFMSVHLHSVHCFSMSNWLPFMHVSGTQRIFKWREERSYKIWLRLYTFFSKEKVKETQNWLHICLVCNHMMWDFLKKIPNQQNLVDFYLRAVISLRGSRNSNVA